MIDKCRVSIDELRHDEEEMNRAKYHEPVTVERLLDDLADMEPVMEGMAYLTLQQQVSLLEAIHNRNLTELGRIVLMATTHYLNKGLDK